MSRTLWYVTLMVAMVTESKYCLHSDTDCMKADGLVVIVDTLHFSSDVVAIT